MLSAGIDSPAKLLFFKLRELADDKEASAYFIPSPLGTQICQVSDCFKSSTQNYQPTVEAHIQSSFWFWSDYSIVVKDNRGEIISSINDEQSCQDIADPYIQSLLATLDICEYPERFNQEQLRSLAESAKIRNELANNH